jgi:Fe-S protein assembly co-chaperone HscB
MHQDHANSPPDPHDAFALLGLPRSPELSARDVQRAYLARVALNHPDVATDAQTAQDRLTALHEAKATLEDSLLRAQALIAWQNLDDALRTALPPAFLMQVMELREAANGALAANDTSELEKLTEDADARLQSIELEFTRMYLAQPGNTKALASTINAWRYMKRLRAALDGER